MPSPEPDPWQAGFQLGDWQVDVSGNRLRRGDEVRPLRHKAMELLLLLARHAGRTVTRDEIIEAIWAGNRYVAPKAINTAVWTIRQTLDDDPEAPRYLETIAKKGYRLIAPVVPVEAAVETPPQLETPIPTSPSTSPSTPPSRPAPRLPRGWLAAGVAGLAAALLATLLLRATPGVDPRTATPPTASTASTGSTASTAPASPLPLTQEPGVEYLGALSPDGRRLAFAWWRGRGVGELHLRRVDSADGRAAPPQPLAAGHGDVTGLAWSADGRALAFTTIGDGGRCRVWLQPLPADDAAAVTSPLPPPPRELARCAALATPILAWSPDGTQIVFSAERDGAGGLFSIAPAGGDPRRLTTAPPAAMADHQPTWAPDGSHLAFVREDPADGTRDLHEWRPGGELRRLTTLKLHSVHGLAHAADGRDLVFSTTRQDTRVLQRWQRADGRVVPLGLEGSAPSRAADGSLVYSLMRTHVSIARLPLHGTPQRVVQGVASDRVPRPDPAGTRLAFVSRRGGAPELWLAAADGSGARALTALGGVVDAPAWAPRGDRLAFVGSCGPGGRIGLCVIGMDAGPPRPLAADAAAYAAPAWHPQRDEVWIASDRGGRWQLWRFAAGGAVGTHSTSGTVEPTALPPGPALHWLADGSGFVYQPRGERHLQWRRAVGPQAGQEQRIDVAASGEELVDWQLDGAAVLTLTRSDRDRWRRVDLASGRREALGDHPLGTLPERARFAPAGPGTVWVEVANTQVADLMRLR